MDDFFLTSFHSNRDLGCFDQMAIVFSFLFAVVMHAGDFLACDHLCVRILDQDFIAYGKRLDWHFFVGFVIWVISHDLAISVPTCLNRCFASHSTLLVDI